MGALAADLEAVRVAVQKTVKTRGKKWKDTTWSNFINDVVSFLLREGRDQDDTAAARLHDDLRIGRVALAPSLPSPTLSWAGSGCSITFCGPWSFCLPPLLWAHQHGGSN
jgi:hypothetical protein